MSDGVGGCGGMSGDVRSLRRVLKQKNSENPDTVAQMERGWMMGPDRKSQKRKSVAQKQHWSRVTIIGEPRSGGVLEQGPRKNEGRKNPDTVAQNEDRRGM